MTTEDIRKNLSRYIINEIEKRSNLKSPSKKKAPQWSLIDKLAETTGSKTSGRSSIIMKLPKNDSKGSGNNDDLTSLKRNSSIMNSTADLHPPNLQMAPSLGSVE